MGRRHHNGIIKGFIFLFMMLLFFSFFSKAPKKSLFKGDNKSQSVINIDTKEEIKCTDEQFNKLICNIQK